MSSLYSDIGGPGSTAAAKLAIADFTAANKDIKVELLSADHQNKPDIGSEHRQPVVRRRKGRPRHRRAEFRRRARGQPDRQHQEQGVHRLRRGRVRSHRSQVQRQHHPLDLRHLDARQRHRQGAGEDRRRQLVLPHRRLRLRSRARARHRAPRSRRPAARCSARFAIRSTPPTSPRSCCRRRLRRPRSSALPMPAATPSTRSSRAPSSASSRADRNSRACWCSRAT